MFVRVAHDFTCPWCWIGLHQAQRLTAEFGVSIDWAGYELWPEALAWPEPSAPEPAPVVVRPATPSRLALAYAAEGMRAPTAIRPKRMRTHAAHLALEHAKSVGVQDAAADALYRSLWERGEAIGEMDVLRSVLKDVVPDVDAMIREVEAGARSDSIVAFDDDAYAAGVFNVPTFFVDGELFAEQPYIVLAQAIRDAA